GLERMVMPGADRGGHRSTSLADPYRAPLRALGTERGRDHHRADPGGGAPQAPSRDTPQPAGTPAGRRAQDPVRRGGGHAALPPARLAGAAFGGGRSPGGEGE